MKQPSYHVCNWQHSNTHSDVPPVHTLFLYLQTLPSPLEWEVEWKHGNQTSSGMETLELAYPPAHGPYFLRLIREMPHGARKKAQNPLNNWHSCFSNSLSTSVLPTTAAIFLQRREIMERRWSVILSPLAQSFGVASSKTLLWLLHELLTCRSRTAQSKTGPPADWRAPWWQNEVRSHRSPNPG